MLSTPRSRPGADVAIAGLVLLACFAIYAPLALSLAKTPYADFINLAFDFDPAYFVSYLTDPRAIDGTGVNYKHPLWMVFRLLTKPFLAWGFAPKEASGLLMALLGAATSSLVYLFLRTAGAGRPESSAATLLFAASSTTLFTSIIVETYGWANFSLVLLWLTYLLHRRATASRAWPRVLLAALVAGVTLTNAMQAMFGELWLRWQRTAKLAAVRQTVLFCVAFGSVLGIMVALFQPHDIWQTLTNPVKTAKDIYWLQTKGDTVGLWQLCKTYFVYSFFAPEFTPVKLSDIVTMLDFRAYKFGGLAFCATLLWCAFMVANVAIGIRSRAYDNLIVPLLIAIAFNVIFHLSFQFRGSVYIYAAHLHFIVFAASTAAAPWATRQGGQIRLAYGICLAALAVVASFVNAQRVNDMIDHMAHTPIPASAPEISPLRAPR